MRVILVLMVVFLASATALACSPDEPAQQRLGAERERPAKQVETTVETTVERTVLVAQEEEEAPSLAVGEAVDLGDVSLRVFDVRSEDAVEYISGPDASPTSEESASGGYVLVDFVAENASGSPVPLGAEATLEDSDGGSHGPDASVDAPGGGLGGEELGVGEKRASTLYFEVPSAAAPETLTLSRDGEEAVVDLAASERGEIPPEDYLHAYHLYFNEKAYDEIYDMIDPASTRGITLGEWLTYFEGTWGSWYLELDGLTQTSEGPGMAAFDMSRTFHESSGVLTPNTVGQEMVDAGEEWKLVLREDQAQDLLASQEPETVAVPYETTTEVTEEVPVTTGDLDCGDFGTQDEAQSVLEADYTDPHRLDNDGDLEACEDLPGSGQYDEEQYDAPEVSPDPDFDDPDPDRRRHRSPGFSPGPSSPGGDTSTSGRDIDCDEVGHQIRTPPGDPNNLDADDDGWACEE